MWTQSKRFSKWKNYSKVFDNLTKFNEIDTDSGIVTLLMTHDTSRVLSVNKKSDE
jgi:non-canonical (house-cleaning) NTP pyrophosphatase